MRARCNFYLLMGLISVLSFESNNDYLNQTHIRRLGKSCQLVSPVFACNPDKDLGLLEDSFA